MQGEASGEEAMKPPDCTAKALKQFSEAPPGEAARGAFKVFTEAQATEERRDASDPRQLGLPGLRVKAAQANLFREGE